MWQQLFMERNGQNSSNFRLSWKIELWRGFCGKINPFFVMKIDRFRGNRISLWKCVFLRVFHEKCLFVSIVFKKCVFPRNLHEKCLFEGFSCELPVEFMSNVCSKWIFRGKYAFLKEFPWKIFIFGELSE